jgi:eukaryotic translation initiation factor 2C
MLINIDISTGVMYKKGPLISLCLEFLGKDPRPENANILSPARGFPQREHHRLNRFISGIRVITNANQSPSTHTQNPRVIKRLLAQGAKDLRFTLREGGTQSVAEYFRQTYNFNLRYPDVLCVEVGNGAYIPMEICTVIPGQIMRKQVPPEKTKDVLDFATQKPEARLNSIKKGLDVLQYGQSSYLRSFGLSVDSINPVKIEARVLAPPTLVYGAGSRQVTIVRASLTWISWHFPDPHFALDTS